VAAFGIPQCGTDGCEKTRPLPKRRCGQNAQIIPAELTGMNWLLPMYCNSTAVPCPPVIPPEVPVVVKV
jgi:hypothetical protein